MLVHAILELNKKFSFLWLNKQTNPLERNWKVKISVKTRFTSFGNGFLHLTEKEKEKESKKPVLL
jgi:hypothetical protein